MYWEGGFCKKRTAYDDVLESAGDRATALWIEEGLVAGLEPRGARLVGDERFGRLFGIVPVAFGKLVAGNAELAALTHGNNVTVCVDDFGSCVRHHFAYCSESRFDAVGGDGVEAGW